MASLTANSLRSGKRAKDAQGSDPHLSKVVELNGKYRLFFRPWVLEDGIVDVAAAMVPGRTCDLDICGTTFIPYTKDMYTEDESHQIDDKTGLKAWARIAKVIHDAQCIREKKNAEAEAQRTAQELGQPLDQVSLSRNLEGIEIKYHGGKAADGTNLAPKERPAISGMQQKLSTQLLVVKLLPTGMPDWKNAKYAVLELSNQRINELIAILDDPNYCNPNSSYIEVGYDYIGADKQAAGRAAKYQGIVASMGLATVDPTGWASAGEKLVAGIANGTTLDEVAEIMRSRNRNLKGGKGPNDIITSMKTWLAKNAAIYGSIDFEAENVEWAAKDFLDAHLVDGLPAIKEQFEKLVAKQEAKKASGENAETTKAPASPLMEAATAPAVSEQEAMNIAAQVAEAGVAQTIKNVINSTPNVEFDDEIGDI